MKKVIIFAGPPGCGKGTQARLLAKRLRYVHISTGELCRNEMIAQTTIGKEIQHNMDNGILVPDSIIYKLLAKAIKQHADAKGFIFDGFPRTKEQVAALPEFMQKHKLHLCGIIEFTLSDKKCIKRMEGRDEDRQDVGKEIYKKRLRDYKEITLPAIMQFLHTSTIFVSDADRSIENIHAEVWEMSRALRLTNKLSRIFKKPVLAGLFLLAKNGRNLDILKLE